MRTLQQILESRSHRDLELTAKAHGLFFSRRISKSEGLVQLCRSLKSGVYTRAIKGLTPSETLALQALVAVGGGMDIWQFSHHFGKIRRYRPWHPSFGKSEDNPRHPWRNPISIAEKLYHLGMIHPSVFGQIEIVQEVAEALPSLPEHQHPVGTGLALSVSPIRSRSLLLRDISALLGVLAQTEAKVLQGRWLSLSVLHNINQALHIKEDLSNCRSELQGGRIRWLHYLAQVTGLLDITQNRWFVTPLAWDWLSAPPQLRWDMLWHALEHDLSQKNRLWDQFRFPNIDAYSALVLRHLVENRTDILHDNATRTALRSAPTSYPIKQILHMARAYMLESAPYDLALFLRHMLAWSGIVSYQQGHVNSLSQNFAPYIDSQLLTPTWLNRSIPIQLSDNPHPPALTRLLSFASFKDTEHDDKIHEGQTIYLTPDTVRTAIRQGYDLAGIFVILSDLTHAPIPEQTVTLLDTWFKHASRTTLKSMLVLESDDPDTITSIHQDWRLRDYMSKKLSPTQLAIHPDTAEDFTRRLQRREYPVTSFLPKEPKSQITESLNPHMADYLLLAVRTYQQLSDHHDSPVTIPSALTHWLRDRASDPTKIEASATSLIEQIQRQIPSQHALPDGLQDHATIERLIRLAHIDGARLTIIYYSPYGDETTTRTIHINEIYESNNQTYIDAFCYQDNDQRTFRLDRIQRASFATVPNRQIS